MDHWHRRGFIAVNLNDLQALTREFLPARETVSNDLQTVWNFGSVMMRCLGEAGICTTGSVRPLVSSRPSNDP